MAEIPTCATDPRFVAARRLFDVLDDPDHPAVGIQPAGTEPADRVSSLIEQEAEDVLAALLGPRMGKWVTPLGRRFGLDGDRLATLADIGDEVGVSRERVRQVQSKVVFPTEPVPSPAADAVLELLDDLLPCTPQDLAGAFAAAGISAVPAWHAEPLLAVLAMTGRSTELVQPDDLVARPGQVVPTRTVLAAARALSNLSGTASVPEVDARLAAGDETVAPGVAHRILRAAAMVHWIGPDTFWVEHAPNRNRLVNTVLRILCVREPQTLTDLQEGVDRNYRWRRSTGGDRFGQIQIPDAAHLEAFLQSHPAFTVHSDSSVTAATPLDEEQLGAEKMAMVAVLRAQPHGVMGRNALLSACAEVGMNTATAQVFMTYAECLKNYGHNVWGLRGLDVTPEVIEQTQNAARADLAAQDNRSVRGLTPSGRPWMARTLTPTIIYSGVVPFDWGDGVLGEDRLDVIDMLDGDHTGTLKFSGTFNYGYNVYFRKNRVQVGDVLRVLADPTAGVCFVETGGQELLSEPFDL